MVTRDAEEHPAFGVAAVWERAATARPLGTRVGGSQKAAEIAEIAETQVRPTDAVSQRRAP